MCVCYMHESIFREAKSGMCLLPSVLRLLILAGQEGAGFRTRAPPCAAFGKDDGLGGHYCCNTHSM